MDLDDLFLFVLKMALGLPLVLLGPQAWVLAASLGQK
jgi:hypothetical protein